MWKRTIFSDGSERFLSKPHPKLNETVKISIRMKRSASLRKVYLSYVEDCLERFCLMEEEKEEEGLVYYACSIEVRNPKLSYHFYLLIDDTIYYYNQLGLQETFSDGIYDFCILANYARPDWVEGKVFYEIFPDRFFQGKKELQVKDGEIVEGGFSSKQIKDWKEAPKEFVEAGCLDFYGGDLYGIQSKIPYLQELGIDGIYVTPIFEAPSVHRYNCQNYYQVDKHLGGDQAFVSLVEELHQKNMKIIVDLSFNHTGTDHPWFREHKEYYYMKEDGSYATYGNIKGMPKLNFESEDLCGVIYNDEGSVLRYWLKEPFSIDGWRFDVGPTVGQCGSSCNQDKIWPGIRRAIKDVNPKAYILSEDWNDSWKYLQGDQWDGIMNFIGCARPVREYIGQVDFRLQRLPGLQGAKSNVGAKALRKRILDTYGKLPFALWGNQFNMLDCHDIGRLHNDTSISWAKYRVAVMYQYFLPGAVCLYYGAEVGIKGSLGSPEGCRYPMEWDHDLKNNTYYDFYHRINQIKRRSEALQTGSFMFLKTEGNVLVCARFTEQDAVLLVSSMEEEDTKISFSMEALGNNLVLPREDLFGEYLAWERNQTEVTLTVPKETGYYIKVK